MQSITSDTPEHSAQGKQRLDVDSPNTETVLSARQNILVALGLVPAIVVAIVANQALFAAKPASGEQHYADVPSNNPFYEAAERLTLLGMTTGYPCEQVPQEPCDAEKRPYFRVGASVTRWALARLLVLAADAREVTEQAQSTDIPVGTQTYTDVPPTHPYYKQVEETAMRDFMQGYPCGGVGEPCDSLKRRYFRPDSVVSRAELALSIYKTDRKIQDNPKTVLSAAFKDVPKDHLFWLYIEQVYGRGIMTGYGCNACSADFPCVPPDNRPYFRPDAPVTNGQVARAIANWLKDR